MQMACSHGFVIKRKFLHLHQINNNVKQSNYLLTGPMKLKAHAREEKQSNKFLFRRNDIPYEHFKKDKSKQTGLTKPFLPRRNTIAQLKVEGNISPADNHFFKGN